MKKIIIATMIVSVLAIAPTTHAQVAEPAIQSVEQQISVLREQLIVLLTQQLQELRAQLAALEAKNSEIEKRQDVVEEEVVRINNTPAPVQVNPGRPASKELNLQVVQVRDYEEDGKYLKEIRLKADDAEAFIHSFEGAYDTLTSDAPKEGEAYKMGEDVNSRFTLTSGAPITVTGVRYSTTASGDVQTKGI